jgi:anti-sigma B factor antagonist
MSSPVPVTSAQGQAVVVTLPAEIDMSSAAAVEAQLLAACAPGVTVVADLSATRFCESSGFRALLRAHQQAAAGNAQLRAAVPSGAVRRMLALLSLDTILQVFPSIAEALAAENPGAPGGLPPLAASAWLSSRAPGVGRGPDQPR